jgi:hypothetical protein
MALWRVTLPVSTLSVGCCHSARNIRCWSQPHAQTPSHIGNLVGFTGQNAVFGSTTLRLSTVGNAFVGEGRAMTLRACGALQTCRLHGLPGGLCGPPTAVKLDSSTGAVIWARQSNTIPKGIGTDIAVDPTNSNIYGGFAPPLSPNPLCRCCDNTIVGPLAVVATASGADVTFGGVRTANPFPTQPLVYVAKLSASTGDCVWARGFSSNGDSDSYRIRFRMHGVRTSCLPYTCAGNKQPSTVIVEPDGDVYM